MFHTLLIISRAKKSFIWQDSTGG